MDRVAITRRVNLGQYEFYELFVEIQRSDAAQALLSAAELMNKGLASLNVGDKIDLQRIKK